MLDRPIAAQILQIVEIDMPIVDLVAAFAQEIADHVLARALSTTRGGNCDKVARGLELGIEAGIDGIEDFLVIDRVYVHHCSLAASIKSYFRCEVQAFQLSESGPHAVDCPP